jgi:AcrR family transcriptional regulator
VARPRRYDDDTRLELVHAAAELLATAGPAALSVRAVADAVGASTSAIYTVFGSKAELVRGMYVAGFQGLAEHLADVPVTDDPWRDVLELGLAYRASAMRQPHLYTVMFGRPVPEFVPDADDAALALGTLGQLRRAVERVAATSGLPDGLAVESATGALWARVHGLASLELAGGLGDGGEPLWRAILLADQRGWRGPGAAGLSPPRG